VPLGAASPRPLPDRPPPAWRWTVALLVPWLVWWAALYPGVVAHDTVQQWHQVLAGRWDDWHPPLQAWLLAIVVRPLGSFAVLSAAQAVVAAALAGRLVDVARRRGAPSRLVWLAVAWMVVSPVFAVGAITVVKDTTFGLVLAALVVLLLPVAYGTPLTGARGVAVGVALATLWLLRLNGPVVVVPTLGALAWRVGRPGRRALVATLATFVLVAGIVRGPVYAALDVGHGADINRQYQIVHRLAAHVHAGTPMTADERAVLTRLMPLAEWDAGYDCVSGEGLFYEHGLPRGMLPDAAPALRALWLRLAWRAPGVEWAHWRCVTRWVWWPTTGVDAGLGADGTTVDPNDVGLAAAPLDARLGALARRALVWTLNARWPRVLVWSPALPLWLVLAALAVACRRAPDVRAPLLVWTPALANTACWLVLSGFPGLRYQWPVVFLAPALACLACAGWSRVVEPG
jgi:hypothetical protein